ncbi:MAG: histidine kinase [Rhodobiaceae bacterium]|nr:histidine kinase [Rhodobiaceae bacterium]MCC0016671.1 histidine kinase [Rhodobiaceae bacterium]MCC0054461.1 histidine kinase [Rhodobiaceae bacterium]
MPTLIRLIVWLAVLAGLAYGGMFALVSFVHNEPTEISERVRLDNLRLE